MDPLAILDLRNLTVLGAQIYTLLDRSRLMLYVTIFGDRSHVML
jgi:hypothetical protein